MPDAHIRPQWKDISGESKGGNIMKKMATIRTANYTRADRTAVGHQVDVRYIASIVI